MKFFPASPSIDFHFSHTGLVQQVSSCCFLEFLYFTLLSSTNAFFCCLLLYTYFLLHLRLFVSNLILSFCNCLTLFALLSFMSCYFHQSKYSTNDHELQHEGKNFMSYTQGHLPPRSCLALNYTTKNTP